MTPDDSALDELTRAAVARLEAELRAAAPFLAERASAWMRALAQSDQPADYFLNPIGFPLLRLPGWLAQTLEAAPDEAFLGDVAYSTINGYYFIRLLDNVMDEGAALERALLPAGAFFHTQFQSAYQRYFPAAHPFWAFFNEAWFHSAEVTARDAAAGEIDLEAFRRWAGQKVSAARIPLAAVCHHAGRADALAGWARFVDEFGAWHQLFNDVFDWNKDLQHGARTYFLSEAARRKHADESPAVWVVREGFDWGVRTLQSGLADARASAAALNSPELSAYLDRREVLLRQRAQEAADGLEKLAQLAAAMRASP